jgi:hypothetical protein
VTKCAYEIIEPAIGLTSTCKIFNHHLKIMYVPITSEISIGVGMVLKEISTEQRFTVAERLKPGTDVSGEDKWRITPINSGNVNRSPLIMARQELSEKYFAEVDDD